MRCARCIGPSNWKKKWTSIAIAFFPLLTDDAYDAIPKEWLRLRTACGAKGNNSNRFHGKLSMSMDQDSTGSKSPFLSAIVPAYNEQPRIGDTLSQMVAYLGSQAYTWELVVVDDGSTDATASLVKAFGEKYPNVHLISVPHGGKGWAVNHGMLWSTGEYRFLSDADLSMPVEQVSRFLPPEASQFDIAIGSRELSGSRRIGEPYGRHLMGRAYNLLVRMLAVPGLSDTQCGFKCFRGPVAQVLFPLQRLYGFAFDVEILYLARKRGLRIEEVPIDWYYRAQSKVKPLMDSPAMVKDILKIRWYYLSGRYKSRPAAANQDSI